MNTGAEATARSRRRLLGAAMGMTAWALSPAARASTPEAPAFDLPRWDVAANALHPTDRVALAALRGRWVYLDFWASWCGPCRQSFPWMNGLSERLAAQRLQVVAIGLDTKSDAMARFVAQHRPRFSLLWDAQQSTPAPYQVQAMPSSYLVDPQGRIVWSHRGFSPSEAPAMEAAVRSRMGVA